MTSIIPTRRAAAKDGLTPKEVVGAVARQPSRFAGLSLQQTYSELGTMDAAVDAALARLVAIGGGARALDTDLEQAASKSDPGIAPDINE